MKGQQVAIPILHKINTTSTRVFKLQQLPDALNIYVKPNERLQTRSLADIEEKPQNTRQFSTSKPSK